MASSVEKYLSILIVLVFGTGLVGLNVLGLIIESAWGEFVSTFGE